MTLRASMLKARIAKLEKELAKEEGKECEADGASMIKGCDKAFNELPPPPKAPKTAEDEDLPPPPPAEFTAKAERRASVRAAMERAIRRRAMRKAMERRAGAEDKIDQDYLTDVEGITKTPSGVVPSIRIIRKLRSASVSLDRIADQLEKQGKIALAYRVDRVADEIDARADVIEARIAKLSK